MIIYKITNLINGKIYIGKSIYNNPNYYGSGTFLNKAIKKHGKENFKKEIIIEFYFYDEKLLNKEEIYWIKYFNSRESNIGYNITKGGNGNFILDNEIKDKIRKIQKIIQNNPEVNSRRSKSCIEAWNKSGNRKEKFSKKMKVNNPTKINEVCEKISKSKKEFWNNPINKKLLSEVKINFWKNPLKREMMIQIQKDVANRPEKKKKSSEGGKLGSIIGNHNRYHKKLNIYNPDCEECIKWLYR